MSRLLLGENLVIRHGYLVRVQDPITPAVIEIEGASRGMGIMHLLGEGDPDKVKIGNKVEAVWKPSEGAAGLYSGHCALLASGDVGGSDRLVQLLSVALPVVLDSLVERQKNALEQVWAWRLRAADVLQER